MRLQQLGELVYWDRHAAADQFDWWSVATHEMGHCLGPIMRTASIPTHDAYDAPRGTVMRQLTADDVAGRNSIISVTPGRL